jgi:flagellar motility protein MotE (MotC chaperone)
MKIIRISFHFFCFLLFVISLMQVARADVTKGEASNEEAGTSLNSLAYELEAKRRALESREIRLNQMELALSQREKDIESKIAELKALKDGINNSMEQKQKDKEDRILKIVSIFETMQPKAAAQILETIDDWLAVEVLSRVETKKAAKVMNIMDRSRSAKISELLTGYYRERNPASANQEKTASGAPQQKPLGSRE